MWCLVQSARPSLLSKIFCGLLRTHVGLILIFQVVNGQKFVTNGIHLITASKLLLVAKSRSHEDAKHVQATKRDRSGVVVPLIIRADYRATEILQTEE
jgi:hypothetical protein